MVAKTGKAAETVQLTSPSGARVTVSAEAADKYKAKGYRGVPGRPAKSKSKD